MTGSETVDRRGARTPRVSPAALAVAGLVVVSTVVRFAAAHWFTTPWIAPDEMVYGLIGESLWSSGTLEVRGLPSPYYSILTPALVGAPLALLDLADGIQWAQLLQALAASLVAVPTYRWARRMASTGWAIAAAATHPRGARAALRRLPDDGAVDADRRHRRAPRARARGRGADDLAVRRSLRRGPRRRQRCGSRLSSSSPPSSSRSRWTRSPPATGPGCDRSPGSPVSQRSWRWPSRHSSSCVAASSRRRPCSGAYTPIGESSGVDSDWMVAILWHAFDVAILGLAIPVLAIAALAFCVFARRDHDPALRAFVAVTLAYVTLLVLQVGLFAAEYVGHVAERYLITALPLLAIGLCAWIARGAPRALAVVLPVWALLVAAAALIPLEQIAERATLVSTLTPSALEALSDGQAACCARRRDDPRGRDGRRGSPTVGMDGRGGRRGDARPRVVRQRPAHRRCLGARGSRRHGLGVSDLARRRGPRGRHAPRDRRSALDIDGADGVLEPRDQRGAPHPAGRAPVPAGHRRRSRSGTTGCFGRRRGTRFDGPSCWRRRRSRSPARRSRSARRGTARRTGLTAWRPDVPVRVHPSRRRAPPERRLRRIAHGSPSMPAGLAPSTSPMIGKTGDPIRAYIDGFAARAARDAGRRSGDPRDRGAAVRERVGVVHLRPRDRGLRRARRRSTSDPRRSG